jgi:drug/metabolite transporter (DMT)-like permease
MPISQKTNGLAIASMVVSLTGVLFVFCYGGGGILGLVGAILGHVAQRQLRERGEGGRGMALAGVIVGWVVLALGILVGAFFIWAIMRVANNPSRY